MTEILKSISDGIAGLSGTALNFAGALAIAGTLAMAILQMIKDLMPARSWVQCYWLKSWFKTRAKKFSVDAEKAERNDDIWPHLPVDAAKAQSTLVELATGGEARAFYDLEIEQVVAQMNAAAQIALEYPKLYFPLLAILSQGADIKDVERILKDPDVINRKSEPDFLDSRNRVGHRIQRNLDGIQIALGSRWKWLMQGVSILFTIVFVELAIFTNVTAPNGWTYVVGFALGLVGGYLAPVTRDIVATLQSLRKS